MASCLKRLWLVAASVVALSAAAQPARPVGPVRLVVPSPAGSAADLMGRLLAQKLGEQMGMPVVVDNQDADAVAKAPADGHTLLLDVSASVADPLATKSPSHAVSGIAAIALVARAPLSIAVNRDLPIADVGGLIEYARRSADNLSFAVGSTGSVGLLATEAFRRAADIDFQMVAYPGGTGAVEDLIGGQIDGFIDPIFRSLAFHERGLLRVIAVTSDRRLASLPDVPTAAETVAGYVFYGWYGLWGPAGLPEDVARRLNAEVSRALASDLRPLLERQGLLPAPDGTRTPIDVHGSGPTRAKHSADDAKAPVDR